LFENGRYAPDQFYRGQFLVRLNRFALCMNPHGFNRVEPRAFLWQKKGQQANALPVLFHSTIMLTDPSTNCLAFVPGSMIPDHNQYLFICQPRFLACSSRPTFRSTGAVSCQHFLAGYYQPCFRTDLMRFFG